MPPTPWVTPPPPLSSPFHKPHTDESFGVTRSHSPLDRVPPFKWAWAFEPIYRVRGLCGRDVVCLFSQVCTSSHRASSHSCRKVETPEWWVHQHTNTQSHTHTNTHAYKHTHTPADWLSLPGWSDHCVLRRHAGPEAVHR